MSEANGIAVSRSWSALWTGVLALALLLLAAWPRTNQRDIEATNCPHPSTFKAQSQAALNSKSQLAINKGPSLLRVKCDDQGGAMTGASALLFRRRLDINNASVTDLSAVPGISESTAQAIIAFRKQKKFNNINELNNIPGIGPKTVQSLRPYLFCRD